MKTFRLQMLTIAAIAGVATSAAQTIPATEAGSDNTSGVPERAIILSGGQNGINRKVMAVLYDTNDLHFQDPDVPRYLLIDRKGTTVFGIGGYVEGVVQYDFDGAIDNNGFYTYDINVPKNPAERNRLAADATHTNIFMELVSNTRFGVLQVYAQGNFSDGNYGFKLKQAYVRLHNVLGGLYRSTFQDAMSGVPTIDYQGPSGAISTKNIQLRYTKNITDNISFALAAEMPKASYTTGIHSADIAQRFPDIPAYVQYSWDEGKSHVRASAIYRNLSYRNLTDQENKFKSGWGVQLSGAVKCTGLATVFYQAAYGKGIGNYVNDLSGFGYDLITDGADGSMKAPGSLGIVGGLRLNLSKKLFVSSSYSLCRLYDQGNLGGDTYKRGNYAVVNCFYTPISDLQFGIEYLHGRRTNVDGENSTANRLEAMVKYSF